MEKVKMGTLRLHYYTTSINVTGDYDTAFNTRLIQIVHGHSKDHRSDLKQFIISLVTNQHGISLFMEPLSGNISDKMTLVRTNLVTDETVYHMADSALYSADTIARLGQQCYWITRVRRGSPHRTVGSFLDLLPGPPIQIRGIHEFLWRNIPEMGFFQSSEQYRKSLQTHANLMPE